MTSRRTGRRPPATIRETVDHPCGKGCQDKDPTRCETGCKLGQAYPVATITVTPHVPVQWAPWVTLAIVLTLALLSSLAGWTR